VYNDSRISDTLLDGVHNLAEASHDDLYTLKEIAATGWPLPNGTFDETFAVYD